MEISLNKSTASVQIGQTTTLVATTTPNNAQVTWLSSDEDVATVSNGVVTGVSTGTAVITAKLSDSVKAQCTVTVTSNGGGQEDSSTLFTADLTNEASVDNGFSITKGFVTKKTGFYQDSGTADVAINYFKVLGTSPLFTSQPSSITFTARLGSGSDKNPLSHNVEACLVDADGNEIAATKRIVTTSITAAANDYEIELPYSADAYGAKIMHMKADSHNIRYYSFSLSYETSTPVGPQPTDYLNNSMPVSYLTADEDTSGTSSTMDYIIFSLQGLSNGVQYKDPFEIAEGVTIRFLGGGNDGKYYNDGNAIRIYSNGTIRIESEFNITQIIYTWDSADNNGHIPDDNYTDTGSYDASTYTWTGSATTVNMTRPNYGSGHWRLKAVQVTYETQSVIVDNVKMRFGAAIPVEDWYDIEASWDIDYYGVMFLKYDTLHDTYGYSSIEDAYEDGIRPRADVHTNEGDMPLPLNGLLIFTARINMTDELNYGVVYVAAPYLVIDGTHYFLEEMEYSVNSMAQEYLDNDLDSTLSNAALTKLATPIPQGD